MQEVLRWLPYPQCISFRVASLVWRWLSGLAPSYLQELCRPISCCTGHCSSDHGNLPATMQHCSSSFVGPTTWNGLPLAMRHLPDLPVLGLMPCILDAIMIEVTNYAYTLVCPTLYILESNCNDFYRDS